ncbi:hypothetical protein ACT2E5_05790 [Burkholderia vietnamiensis]
MERSSLKTTATPNLSVPAPGHRELRERRIDELLESCRTQTNAESFGIDMGRLEDAHYAIRLVRSLPIQAG